MIVLGFRGADRADAGKDSLGLTSNPFSFWAVRGFEFIRGPPAKCLQDEEAIERRRFRESGGCASALGAGTSWKQRKATEKAGPRPDFVGSGSGWPAAVGRGVVERTYSLADALIPSKLC